MIDKRYAVGGIVGFMIAFFFLPISIDAAIPPTPAWKIINVDTSSWFGSATSVNATAFDDTVYLVSDGSLFFNVTNTP